LEAENPGRALRIVQRLGGRLDLIITDIKMPGEMDGLDLAFSIRNSFPNLPVILISGGADESLRDSLKSEAFPFVQKPFSPETLLRAVRTALIVERRRSR
jgi:two-component system, cell cycle sensor histidine kinase and response regulator CckA